MTVRYDCSLLPLATRKIVFLITGFVVCSVQNPGKCQSFTFSTYTFTTCRILHPSDVTQVTAR